jgi:hypothetical protein
MRRNHRNWVILSESAMMGLETGFLKGPGHMYTHILHPYIHPYVHMCSQSYIHANAHIHT